MTFHYGSHFTNSLLQNQYLYALWLTFLSFATLSNLNFLDQLLCSLSLSFLRARTHTNTCKHVCVCVCVCVCVRVRAHAFI